MASYHFFSELFTRIDSITSSFVSSISSNAITEITPVVTAGLTVSFIIYGFLVARGVIDHSLLDFMWRSFKIGAIVSIAMSGGIYQTSIAEVITSAPDKLAVSLLPSSTNASQAQGSAAANLMDGVISIGFEKAQDAYKQASFFDPGEAFAFITIAVLILLATIVLTGVGAAFVLVAKISLAVLAGLGPFFIFALIFKSTQRFFESWSAQIFTYTFMIILISSVFGVMMQIYTSYITQIDTSGSWSLVASVGGCLLLSLISLVIFLQIPSMAGALGGGISSSLWNELQTAKSMGRTGIAAGKAAGNAALAVGKAATAFVAKTSAGVTKAAGLFRGSRK